MRDLQKQAVIDSIRGRLKAGETVMVEVFPGDGAWREWLGGQVLPVRRIEPVRGRVTLEYGSERWETTSCPLDHVRLTERVGDDN